MIAINQARYGPLRTPPNADKVGHGDPLYGEYRYRIWDQLGISELSKNRVAVSNAMLLEAGL